MTEQMEFLQAVYEPGQWVTEHGRELSFEEVTHRVGELIVMDKSTESHRWYQIVRVERIVEAEGTRRLVYFDGKKQRGLVGEIYFPPAYKGRFPARAYEISK